MFYPALMLLCKRFFDDDHEALEILNDGMIKVFKNLHVYDPMKGNFFNWIYTIVRNTALDKLRLMRLPATKELSESVGDNFADNPLQKLEWEDIYRLLYALPIATRAVCGLYYIEGFSISEISKSLLVSNGTVKWHLHESRKKLKPVLEKYYL